MTHRLDAVTRCLLTALAAMLCATGCQSVKTVRLYTGPDLPADRVATLVVPWCVGVRAVDGAMAPWTLADGMRLLFKPGAHTLEARYEVLYPLPSGDTEKVTSDYVALAFTAVAGKTYTLCSRNPQSLDATRRYAEHVSLWIEEGTARPVKGAAMKTAPATPATPASTVPLAAAPVPGPGDNPPEMQAQLQALWDKASEKDRKAFLDKVLRQQP